jgi:hypothetical protein
VLGGQLETGTGRLAWNQSVTRARGATVLTASAVPGQPGAWIISSGAVNAAGQPASTLPAACTPTAQSLSRAPGSATAFHGDGQRCLASHLIREAVSYQPASHYWPLQLTEAGIFLALAVGLAGWCSWRLGRRLA